MSGETNIDSLDLATQCSATLQARFFDVFGLAQSGIVVPDSVMKSFFAEISGSKFRIRNWTRISGRAVADDGTDATAFKELSSEGEEAIVFRRRINLRIFQAAIDAGGPSADVIAQVAAQTPMAWARESQSTFWDILKALFTPSTGVLSSSHSYSVAKSSGTPQGMTRACVRAAKAKLGDAAAGLTVGIAPSSVIEDLRTEHYTTNPAVAFPMDNYEGLKLIEDDSLEEISGSGSFKVYPLYIFRPGSLGLMLQRSLQVIQTPNAVKNAWDIVQSMPLVPHVFGVSFTGTPSSTFTPTEAELKTVGNWTKRTGVETKDIGVVAALANLRPAA